MKVYFNLKTNNLRETIDELNSLDFESRKEFFKEKTRLVREYHLAGMEVYVSSRACKGWN